MRSRAITGSLYTRHWSVNLLTAKMEKHPDLDNSVDDFNEEYEDLNSGARTSRDKTIIREALRQLATAHKIWTRELLISCQVEKPLVTLDELIAEITNSREMDRKHARSLLGKPDDSSLGDSGEVIATISTAQNSCTQHRSICKTPESGDINYSCS